MLINTGKVTSSEFMVSDFSFLREWGTVGNVDLTQRVCRTSQEKSGSSAQNLWAHDPSEWVSSTPLALEAHDDCSCQVISKVHLFHAHSLLIDRRLFRNFVESLSDEGPAPKIVVCSRGFESAVLTYFKNIEKKKWISDYLYFLYVTLVCSISEQNVVALRQHFILFETRVEELHENFEKNWSALEEFLEIQGARPLRGGSNLKLRGLRWTGGYGDTQFQENKAASQSPQFSRPFYRRLANWFDPNNHRYPSLANRVFRNVCLVGGDAIAICLLPYFVLSLLFRGKLLRQPQPRDPHLVAHSNKTGLRRLTNFIELAVPILPYIGLRTNGSAHFRNSRKRLERRFLNF
jgi:hypothetical protein